MKIAASLWFDLLWGQYCDLTLVESWAPQSWLLALSKWDGRENQKEELMGWDNDNFNVGFFSLLSVLLWLKIFVLALEVCISFYITSSCHYSNSDWRFLFCFVLQRMYYFYFQLCFWIQYFGFYLRWDYLIHHLGIEIEYMFWVRVFRRELSVVWRWFLFSSTSNAFIITLKEVKVV